MDCCIKLWFEVKLCVASVSKWHCCVCVVDSFVVVSKVWGWKLEGMFSRNDVTDSQISIGFVY